MLQRIFEMIAGGIASLLGFVILFSLYSYLAQSPMSAWVPVTLAFATALAAMTLGPLLHGLPTFSHAGRHTRIACAWIGRATLWLATLGLIALVCLTGFSIGLAFLVSVPFAVLACVLAVLPDGAPSTHRAAAVS